MHFVHLILAESRTRQDHAKVKLNYYNFVNINEEIIGVFFVVFLCDDAKNLYHICGFFCFNTPTIAASKMSRNNVKCVLII